MTETIISTPEPKRFKTKKDYGFAGRMHEGWTKEQLMKHFCMSENEYNRTVECVKRIEAEGTKG